jgi:hypothetical protein
MPKIILIVIFLITPLINLFSQGQVVTDPRSYTHYIDMLAKAQEQLEKTNEMIRDTKDMKQGVSEVRTNLNLAYDNTFGILGQLNDYVEELKEIPESLKATLNEWINYVNCISEDIENYKKVETLRKAKYYRKTPKDHPFNFGTETVGEEGKIPNEYYEVSDNFGSDGLTQFEERPCNTIITFQEEVEAKQNAFNTIYDKVGVYKEKYLSEEGIKKHKEKLEKLQTAAARPNQSLAQVQGMARDILIDIKIELGNIADLLYLMAAYQLENQQPPELKYKLNKSQKANLNSLTDEQIYKNNNIERLLDELIDNYGNENFEGKLLF